MLSVIIPSYNEEDNIAETAEIVGSVLNHNSIDYEILFVDDGSGDHTWDRIRKNAAEDSHVRGIRFSKNFGKEAAIYAGLANAQGDCAAVMDCDRQHPPDKLVEMYRLWEQGAEIVEGVKRTRGEESAFHTFCTRIFYNLISEAAGVDMSRASDFKLLDRKAVNILLNIREKRAFFRALSSWIGFRTAQVEFDVQERTAGASKWSPLKLTRYAIVNITSFTTLPMQIVTVLGGLMLLVTIIQGIEAIVTYLRGQALGGFTTVILLQLFIGSITMLSLGIIGYYLARIFEEVMDRPRYIVSETAGREAQSTQNQ